MEKIFVEWLELLLLAGIGGPGAGVVGACGGALALLTFGSVPAEKQ